MGNICCQTDIQPSPFDRDLIKIDQYDPAEKPEADEIIDEWFKKNDQIKSEEVEATPAQLMKHKDLSRYYYGKWKDSVPHGKGFIYEPAHLFYDGQFENGLPTGHSNIRFLDKKCQFQGQIKAGKAHGEGVIDNLQQKFRFKGIWENSKPKSGILTLFSDPNISTVEFQNFSQGKATISYKDNRKYVGQIDNQKIKPHGKGTVTFPINSPKSSYEGQWKDGQMHGRGKLIWNDGSYYDGDYVNGKKQGEGKFMFASKNYYEGFWANGKQEGTGILFDKDGSELKKGLWSAGAFKQRIAEEEWAAQKQKCAKRYEKVQSENSQKNDSEQVKPLDQENQQLTNEAINNLNSAQKEQQPYQSGEKENDKKSQNHSAIHNQKQSNPKEPNISASQSHKKEEQISSSAKKDQISAKKEEINEPSAKKEEINESSAKKDQINEFSAKKDSQIKQEDSKIDDKDKNIGESAEKQKI